MHIRDISAIGTAAKVENSLAVELMKCHGNKRSGCSRQHYPRAPESYSQFHFNDLSDETFICPTRALNRMQLR